jgi:hypothetical protein
MNRTIKFSGKSVNGDWCYGLLSESQGKSMQPPKGFYISNKCGMPWAYQIRPETVGQFTGLKDKNGKEIYEGDIIERRLLPTKRICTRSIVKYADRHAAFAINDINGSIIEDHLDSILQMEYEIEVIGNIHDNPELLKQEEL